MNRFSINRIRHNHRGFSLLEISLVLAISSLLIIAIFYAYGQGQILRRDNQRKNALHLIAINLDRVRTSALDNFSYPNVGNGSTIPGDTCSNGYDLFLCWFDSSPASSPDPQHGYYAISTADNTDPLAKKHYNYYTNITAPPGSPLAPTSSLAASIIYNRGWACGQAPVLVGAAGYNQGVYNLATKLEDGAIFCVDNH